jgi:transcriptional regulator with XRE-family HTH domain
MKSPIEEDEIYNRRLDFCALLKQKRLDTGLSIEELSKLTGISINNISRIENGKWNFGINILLIISVALDFDINFS